MAGVRGGDGGCALCQVGRPPAADPAEPCGRWWGLDRLRCGRSTGTRADLPDRRRLACALGGGSVDRRRFGASRLAQARARNLKAAADRCTADAGNGYRSTKPQGESNFTISDLCLCHRHFCDFLLSGARRPFISHSSRSLNCPSNLIGHDPLNNRPGNGVGEDNRV